MPDTDEAGTHSGRAFMLVLHVLYELKQAKVIDGELFSKCVCGMLGLDKEWNEAMCRRDNHGRFALTGGGSGKNQGLTKHKAGSIIKKNAGKRENAKNKNRRGARGYRLMEHIRHELNTHLRKDEFEAGETVRCIGDHRYRIRIYEFDNYMIIDKKKIK